MKIYESSIRGQQPIHVKLLSNTINKNKKKKQRKRDSTYFSVGEGLNQLTKANRDYLAVIGLKLKKCQS